jgi:RimJ/RimL family protein N-acetyltransferase
MYIAVRALTDWAFASFDVVRISAGVFESNPASARVLEKCGFELEGRQRRHVTKDGRTFDQLAYARLHP